MSIEEIKDYHAKHRDNSKQMYDMPPHDHMFQQSKNDGGGFEWNPLHKAWSDRQKKYKAISNRGDLQFVKPPQVDHPKIMEQGAGLINSHLYGVTE